MAVDIDFAKLDLKDALDLAILIEDEALKVIEDPGVRELFEELREEEVEHQQLVQQQIDRLPEDRPVDPDDYVDPPRAL